MKKRKLKRLKKDAMTIFSLYIRLRDNGVCFTCGVKKEIKQMHAGHFKHHRLDFDETNRHAQCPGCNMFRNGRLDVYAARLIERYGEGIIQTLDREANEIKKYSRGALELIIDHYTQKVKELQ